jgi:glutaredoxin 3
MSDVTIYTKTGCPYCAAAKKHYSDQGIAFEEINVQENPEEMDKVLNLTGGKRIVPVVIDHGELKIGFGGG